MVLGDADSGPDVAAVELGHPRLGAVGDRHRLAAAAGLGEEAELLDELAHDLDCLAGRRGALESHVLGQPAVDKAVTLGPHHVLDFLADVCGGVDAERRFGNRHALLVHEGVAGHEVPIRVPHLGHLAEDVPAVAQVGVRDNLALRAFGPVSGRNDAQRVVGHARVVVMGDDTRAVDRRLPADAEDGARVEHRPPLQHDHTHHQPRDHPRMLSHSAPPSPSRLIRACPERAAIAASRRASPAS